MSSTIPEDPRSPALRAGVDFRGTANATERVTEHVRAGRTRAPLLRYIRINLPRTTRLLLIAVIAVIGAASAGVALSGHEPFPGAAIVQWILLAAAVLFAAVGLLSAKRIWTAGVVIAVVALIVYVIGIFGDAPYVWNGATITLAATWNLTLLAALGYLVLFWALRFGMIAAYPDDQNFMD